MSTIEDNKLIAEFMGLETPDRCYFEHLTKKGERKLSHFVLLEYHTSWDWLMPVVERIESDERYDVDILQYGTRITDNQKEIVNNIANISFDKKIDHTYDAVIAFIRQYYELNIQTK